MRRVVDNNKVGQVTAFCQEAMDSDIIGDVNQLFADNGLPRSTDSRGACMLGHVSFWLPTR